MQQILLFFWINNTYTTLLGPTRLSISDISPSKPDFQLQKKKKSFLHGLIPTRLSISEKSATYKIKWSYTVYRYITHSKKFAGKQGRHQTFDQSILPYKFGLIFKRMKQKKNFF